MQIIQEYFKKSLVESSQNLFHEVTFLFWSCFDTNILLIFLGYKLLYLLKDKQSIFINLKYMLGALCSVREISKEKVTNLVIGIGGIYTTFFLAGIIHESMIKGKYQNYLTKEAQTFNYPIGFLIFNTGFAWIFGAIYNRFEQTRTYLPKKKVILSALMVLISTLTYTIAIYFTNFPIVIMFKSCNLLSIILVSLFCSRVKTKALKLSKNKLIVGIIITIGIILFNLYGKQDQQSKKDAGNLWIGLPLLITSLVADGFLPDFQAELKDTYKPKPMQMFQQINKWVCILSILYSICYNFQIVDICLYMYQHPKFALHMLIMCVLSTVGQVFVYRMIKQFKQHIVPFVITTRKIFTVILSIVFYGHSCSLMQYVAICIVLFSVVIEFMIQMNKKAVGDVVQTQQKKPNQFVQWDEVNENLKQNSDEDLDNQNGKSLC